MSRSCHVSIAVLRDRAPHRPRRGRHGVELQKIPLRDGLDQREQRARDPEHDDFAATFEQLGRDDPVDEGD